MLRQSRKRFAAISPARAATRRTIPGRSPAHDLDVACMRFFLAAFYIAFANYALASTVKDVSPQRGQSMAPINWTDDAGQVRRLSEFAGFPVILLPIYTRCPTACIANVHQLKAALSGSSADPRQFRVLLFSFDASDTPEKLIAYRS